MTPYDWLLIFLGGGLLVLFAVDGLLRGLFSAVVLWSATLASAALYRELAFRVQAIGGSNPVLTRGVVFDILFVLFLIAGYVLIRLAFPVTKLPSLGFLDNLLGLVVGVVITVTLISVLVNSMGVMTVERWPVNEQGWTALRSAYVRSGLRPLTTRVMGAYGWLFVPFFRGLPPVLVPQ
ncbi:MAG: CvpA family protein [Anaerolineae bacterium]